MSQFASIDAVTLLQDLRRELVNFCDDARMAIMEADADVTKTLRWLEMEAQPFWEQAYKKREEKLLEAQEAFRKKTLYKAIDGTAQSVTDERKALQRARAALEEADAKRKAVKSWRIKLEQEAILYRGLVQPVMRAADSDIPMALERLDRMRDALDAYISLTAPATRGAEAASDSAGSMARPADSEGDTVARPETDGSVAEDLATDEEGKP